MEMARVFYVSGQFVACFILIMDGSADIFSNFASRALLLTKARWQRYERNGTDWTT